MKSLRRERESGLLRAVQKIGNQDGFITEHDADYLLLEHGCVTRLLQVLVRCCGGRRFNCALHNLEGMTRAMEKDGEYIRDVSVRHCDLQEMVGEHIPHFGTERV